MQNNIIKFLVMAFFAVVYGNNAIAEEMQADHKDIEISEQAIKNYGITATKLMQNSPYTLKKSYVINAQDKYFVYKKDGDGFEQIQISPLEMTQDDIIFENDEINNGDEIVISGTKYLRVIFLNMENKNVGHSH